MELNEVKRIAIATKGGTYVKVFFKKDLADNIRKETQTVVRLGVAYENIKGVESKHQGLPWGEWLKDFEGLIIAHKGNYYLRVATSKNNTRPITQYFIDNELSTKEQVEQLVKLKPSFARDVFDININNIIAIG